MQIFAYARVSTERQRNRHTIKNQKARIKQYCKDHGHTINNWFLDDGVSGVKERPQLKAMLTQLEDTDGVVVTKLDRLGRSVLQILETIELIQGEGKQFLCTEKEIDFTTSEGRFGFQVIAAVAELERSLARDRILAGIERARREGKHLGRREKTIPKERLRLHLQARTSMKAIGRLYPDPKTNRPMDTRTIKRIAQDYKFMDKDGTLLIDVVPKEANVPGN